MSWIKIQNGLVSNKKTARLAKEMHWNRFQTVGFLVSFWIWAVENCEDGQLGDTTDTEIGFAVGMENCTGILEGLIVAGLVDKSPLQIHNWVEHQYEFLRTKYRNNTEKLQQTLGTRPVQDRCKTGVRPVQDRIDKRERERERGEGEFAELAKIIIKRGEQTPPTLSEVRGYGEAERLKTDPDRFFSWQVSRGWAGVIDWKAALRYWDRTEYPDKISAPAPKTPRTNPADAHFANMEETKRRNLWHEKHLLNGKCSFCGVQVKALSICPCSKYTETFEKQFGFKDGNCFAEAAK